MQDIMQKYYSICQWITRLMYLNFLWLLFSLMGLFVLSFFPATTAMFSVVRKWTDGEENIPVFRTFWSAFKSDFVKANFLGYLMSVIGYILYIDLQILRAHEGISYQLISFAVLGLFLVYFIASIYIIPLFAHIQMKTIDYLKWSIVIGVTHPVVTLLIGAGIFIPFYVMTQAVPGLIFIFFGSTSAFVIQWAFSKIIPKFTVSQEGGSYGDIY